MATSDELREQRDAEGEDTSERQDRINDAIEARERAEETEGDLEEARERADDAESAID